MQTTHIEDVMETGCFVSNRILRVLDSPNEGITYCIQYIADTMEKYNEYQEKFAAKFQSDFPKQFSNKFVAFRTVMEFISRQ